MLAWDDDRHEVPPERDKLFNAFEAALSHPPNHLWGDLRPQLFEDDVEFVEEVDCRANEVVIRRLVGELAVFVSLGVEIFLCAWLVDEKILPVPQESVGKIYLLEEPFLDLGTALHLKFLRVAPLAELVELVLV